MPKIDDATLVRLRVQHSGNSSAESHTINALLSHIDELLAERNEAQSEVERYKNGNVERAHGSAIEAIEKRDADKVKGNDTVLDTLSTMPKDEKPAYIPPTITDGSTVEEGEKRNALARKEMEEKVEELKRRDIEGKNAVVPNAEDTEVKGTAEATYASKLQEKEGK